jgi:hypothetical protein
MSKVLDDPIIESPFPPERDFDDLTDEEKAEVVHRFESTQRVMSAQQYLKDTDWYTSRKAETGKDIPENILALRAQARIDASEESS